MRYIFEWDPTKDRGNRAKHGVGFRQATLVFRDPLAVSIYDEAHSIDEDRWLTVGQSDRGALLVIAHTFRQIDTEHMVVRLFSARPATPQERRQYEERS
jgi:uncharacterized DUF497 family protein